MPRLEIEMGLYVRPRRLTTAQLLVTEALVISQGRHQV